MSRAPSVSPSTDDRVASKLVGGPGVALPTAFRKAAEARFGHDFGSVRVHVDQDADVASDVLGARAFTLGNDVFFSRGAYDTQSPVGVRLIAHELAHAVQQGGAGGGASREPAPLESEAREAAARFSGPSRIDVRRGGGVAIAKQGTTTTPEAPGSSILKALRRNDGTALFVAINQTTDALGAAGSRQLVSDLEFRSELRELAQGAFLFTILRRLSFRIVPAYVTQFEVALSARNGPGVIAILQQSPSLRDPDQVPGVYEVVEHVFKGTPQYAQMMQLLSFDVSSVLATAKQSHHFTTLLGLAGHFAGVPPDKRDTLVGKGAEPGHTFTAPHGGGIVIQPDVPTPQAALMRVTHEVSNLALQDQFEVLYDRRNSGGFSSARQYAEAFIEVEAQSVVERHEVAVDLGLHGDDAVVDNLVRQRRSGAISQAALDAAVTDRVKKAYRGPGGVPAIETYERQFRDWQRLHQTSSGHNP